MTEQTYQSPLVSIIMIFFNAKKEDFFEAAIKSIFAQTYENWELLLADDGSTDASTDVALYYAQQYPEKVRYLEHEGHQNRGMSATRNLGIRHTQGKYISFLDSDDVWLSHKLEYQVATIEAHPEIGFVCNPAQWWYSWTGKPDDRPRDFTQKFELPLDMVVKPPALLKLFLEDEWASLCDILVRREVVEAVGGYEASFRGMYEDQAFHAKLCLQEVAFVASECWYRYRQHPQACTATSHKTRQTESAREMFLTWLETYLLKQDLQDTEIWQVVQNQLYPYRHPQSRLLIKQRRFRTRLKGLIKRGVQKALPLAMQRWLRIQWKGREASLPLGLVNFGNLARLTPISQHWGFDRGLPIDRYYIEQFLSTYQLDIQGHVLEIANNTYTYRFGNDRVTKSDVLYVKQGNPSATIVGDLTNAEHIPSDVFDCIILTQTLQFIYDFRAALKTLHRILKPGGILLVTFPGISQISSEDMDRWGEYWRFTGRSAQRLFEEFFPPESTTVEVFGNVLSTIAFLQGLAAEELRQEDLDYRDPNYETLITVKTMKPKQVDADTQK